MNTDFSTLFYRQKHDEDDDDDDDDDDDHIVIKTWSSLRLTA